MHYKIQVDPAGGQAATFLARHYRRRAPTVACFEIKRRRSALPPDGYACQNVAVGAVVGGAPPTALLPTYMRLRASGSAVPLGMVPAPLLPVHLPEPGSWADVALLLMVITAFRATNTLTDVVAPWETEQ